MAARDAENVLSPTYRIAALTLMTEIWLSFKITQKEKESILYLL